MGGRRVRAPVVVLGLFLGLTGAFPARSLAQGCIDPTGLPTPCPEDTETNTPRPRATRTPTPTPTATETATVTLTPTATLTVVPTHTPFPTPSQPPPPFYVDLISNFVGELFPDPQLIEPLPVWMQPPNLELTDIEITQVIQCMHNLVCADNSVPLFSGKLTMVRAYVRIHGGPYSTLFNIGGALCYGNTGAGGCLNPIRPISKLNLVWDLNDPVSWARPQLSYTLDFILPSYMVSSAATQNLTVYVNYNFEDEPKEKYYKDNYRTLTYQAETSQPINIRYHYVQNKLTMPNAGRIWDIYDFLDLTYPTSQVNLTQGVPLFGKDYAWSEPDGGCGKGWGGLLKDLLWLRNGSGPLPYGLVPASTVTKYGGCGSTGGPGAAGIDTISAGRIAAQEIGHNLGRAHAPGCGAGGPDMNFPGVNGGIDEVGTDVLHRKLYEPYWVFDYMGYCGGASNSWTSIYTYEAMAGQLPAGAYLAPDGHVAAPVPAEATILLGSGEVSPEAVVLEHGFYLLPAGASLEATPNEGPYLLEFVDSSGQVLASHHFAPLALSNDVLLPSGPFLLLLPWAEGATSVVFRHEGVEIGRVAASRRAPVITWTSPAEGQAWDASGLQTLAWAGSDADGDPLQYLLQYSSDGGETWQVLAPNLEGTSFEIDSAYLPGSGDGRLRLVASDGLNTVSVDSAPLTVGGKSPMVHITGPTAGDVLVAGSPVVLQGAATDLEDGFLGDDSLSWSSDRDGALGSGRTAVLASLSEGPHTLTLLAVDSDGNAATASVDLVVQPAPVYEPPRPAPSPLWCWAGLIVIVGGLVVGAFALGRRSRQRPTGGS